MEIRRDAIMVMTSSGGAGCGLEPERTTRRGARAETQTCRGGSPQQPPGHGAGLLGAGQAKPPSSPTAKRPSQAAR